MDKPIIPEQYYLIDGHSLLALYRIAKRLYTENRMSGDEMRDAAQAIDAFVDLAACFPYEEEDNESVEILIMDKRHNKQPAEKFCCPDCGYEYLYMDGTKQCDERGNDQWVCDRCSSVRDQAIR